MKIVIINTVANTGSTGRIVTSLYRAIEKQGDEARIVYGRGSCFADIKSYKIGTQLDFLNHVMKNFFRGESGFASTRATYRLISYLQAEKPDIIHLHNLHGFYLNCEVLFDYIKKANITTIWTLHDCWSFTGHCAYFDYHGCDQWIKGCHSCKYHRDTYPYALFCDNSYHTFTRKKMAFLGVENLTIVTPCDWLKKNVEKSFLNKYPVKIIYNGIDTDKFYRKDTSSCKNSSKEILGVANVWERRKGLMYFEQLANKLPNQYRIILIGLNLFQRIRLRCMYPLSRLLPLGKTKSIDELRMRYEQAMVYVNPTLEENFPTTNIEALACGTPVITFDTGGSPESINRKCGRVVERGNIKELVKAIESIALDEKIDSMICREQGMKYGNDIALSHYIELYKEYQTKCSKE